MASYKGKLEAKVKKIWMFEPSNKIPSNGPPGKVLELLDTSSLGVHSVGPTVGDFLEFDTFFQKKMAASVHKFQVKLRPAFVEIFFCWGSCFC